MKKYFFLILLITLFFISVGYKTAKGTQWSTNFGYKNQTDMKENGWTLTNPEGITFTGPGIILRGGASVGVYSVPTGIFDWKVDATGSWIGGFGHSYVNIQVYTEKHSYLWVADGSRSQYVFYRDGVDTIHLDGYHEAANANVAVTMHKIGNTIALYCNSALLKNYAEPDTQMSRVTAVSIISPPSGSVKYTFASGYVPTPSTGGGSDTSSESNPNTVYPDGDVPDPPLPSESTPQSTEETPPPASTNPVIILEMPVLWTFGTAPPSNPNGDMPGIELINGVGQNPTVGIFDASPEFLAAQQAQLKLYEQGKISPETFPGYNPYGGWPISYIVTISVHVSGEAINPNSVEICSIKITDGSGTVLYTDRVSSVVNDQRSAYDLYNRAQATANAYLEAFIPEQTK